MMTDEFEQTLQDVLEDATLRKLDRHDCLRLMQEFETEKQDESTPTQRVAGSLYRYLQEKESLLALQPDLQHPCTIAMTYDVMQWMYNEFGGALAYWQLMLDAAREWFPNGEPAGPCQLFCTRLEMTRDNYWEDIPEFHELNERYLAWRDSLSA